MIRVDTAGLFAGAAEAGACRELPVGELPGDAAGAFGAAGDPDDGMLPVVDCAGPDPASAVDVDVAADAVSDSVEFVTHRHRVWLGGRGELCPLVPSLGPCHPLPALLTRPLDEFVVFGDCVICIHRSSPPWTILVGVHSPRARRRSCAA